MKKITTLLLLSSLLSGCAAFIDKVPTESMIPKLTYHGFTVKRPVDNKWCLYQSEQEPFTACFRLDRSSRTYSAYTLIQVSSLQAHPESIDEFEKQWKKEKTSTSGRMKLLEYTSSQSMKQGQWCINYSLKSLDTEPVNSDTPLVMTMKGFVVLHPNWPDAIIDAYVSQRGTKDDLTPEIDESGKSILEGVRLESALGKEI